MSEENEGPEDDDGDGQMEMFRRWFKEARDASHDWRVEARICFDFVSGDQWNATDTAILKDTGRPVITFNRVGSVIDSVAGLEVTNRQEVRYIPRQVGASGVNELLTDAAKWIRDECNAEDEESDSFLDEIICGMGWTETRIDYDANPEGQMNIVRVDPMEMFWDANARQRNLIDAKHVFRVRNVSTEDAREEFPGFELNELDAGWARDANAESGSPHDAQEAPFYRNDQSPELDKDVRKVTLVEVQWWELERGHKVLDPESGTVKVMLGDEFAKMKKRMDAVNKLAIATGMTPKPPIKSVPMKRRVYKRAILGSKVLREWDGPEKGGFTYKAMTGKRDRNKGMWYGLVRAMIDPQKWANKWLSQVLHIINSNAKGGYWAESDAFENPQEAMDTISDPSAVTLLTPGTLQNKKIEAKVPVPYPEGIDRLMQFAISSIRDTTGVNLELLGMANKDQPGILEHQRKQAGMTILAGLFDSLRHYRKEQGRLMLWYITNFLSDGRLVRIGGPQNARYVPLVHQPGITEFDVIVDDTPSSPNQKEQTWAVLSQMFPFLAKMEIPTQMLVKLLEYSPLPSSLVADIQEMSEQQAQAQQQQDPKLVEAQAKAQETQANAQATQATTQAEIYRAQADVRQAELQTQAEMMKTHHSMALGERDSRRADLELLLTTLLQAKAQEQNAKAKEEKKKGD